MRYVVGFCVWMISLVSFSQESKKLLTKDDLKKIDKLWFENIYQPSLIDSVFTSLEQPSKENVLKWNDLPTDTLKKRLALLDSKSPFHIEYNPELERLIKSYLKYRRKYYPAMIARSAYYFPLFEEQLALKEMPLEIKYLSIVESALKPRAKSWVGATGLWQFMYQTGKIFDLKVSSYVDERMDPIKSTAAAATYLQQLYNSFNDWDLALAAYNSGPGNVSKAIRRSGGHKNYWNIRPYLPRETAGYLPAFYATLYIWEYAKEHHIYMESPVMQQFQTDTVQVKQLITFDHLHDALGTDMDLLEFLNPEYKLNIIPHIKGRDYKVVLPVEDALEFASKEAEVYAYADRELKEREKPLAKYFEMNERIRYRVRSGDYLGRIGNKFGVSVRSIKKWNNLRSNNLRIGQRLTIYPRRISNVTSSSSKSKKTTKKVVVGKGKKISHTVRNGDTLWAIATKYKVTVSKLRDWNGLWNSNNLNVGDDILIYK